MLPLNPDIVHTLPSDIRASTQAELRHVFDTKPDEAHRAAFDINRHALAQVMRSLGLTSVSVRYFAGSDCRDYEFCWIDEIGDRAEDADDGPSHVPVALIRYRWDDASGCGTSELEFDKVNLREAAQLACDAAIELTSSTRLEGSGCGTFTLHAGDAYAELAPSPKAMPPSLPRTQKGALHEL